MFKHQAVFGEAGALNGTPLVAESMLGHDAIRILRTTSMLPDWRVYCRFLHGVHLSAIHACYGGE